MSIQDNTENSNRSVPIYRRYEVKEPEPKPRKIIEVNISILKPHPRNTGIYGHEDVSDLVALIKERGHIVNSLVINKDNTIISGHRRWMAAKVLEYQTVPCEVIEFDSVEDELEALIHYNASREKTFESRVRESMALEEVYSTKAGKRSLGNLKQNNTDKDNLTISDDLDDDTGATRDIVAKKAGISSGKTYERGKKVVQAVDRLREKGNQDDAELLISILNRSASSAADLADETILSGLSEDDKSNLKHGKVSVRSLIPKNRVDQSKKKPSTNYATTREHVKVMSSSAKALKNIDLTGMSDKQTQKIRDDIGFIINSLQELLSDDTVNTP
jgi:ParB family chromosome partitioning protein